MRQHLVFVVLGLCLPATGCQMFVNGPRNVLFEVCDRTGNWVERGRNRKLARAAWADRGR